MSHIAIIGAGPIGLEAALLARQLGHDVQVFEKGRVAENVLDWGHVRLFSPFGMNSSEWGRGALAKTLGSEAVPRDDELLTGREFAERYLIPLSRLAELTDCIHEHTNVRTMSRRHFRKTDGIGSAARGREPFQLLIESHSTKRSVISDPLRDDDHVAETLANGTTTQTLKARHELEEHRINERVELADVVLDCSGTYPNHNWLGDGGMPCNGERNWLNEDHYRLPIIREAEFRDRNIAVIGSGFSAATSVVTLAGLAKLHPRTKVLWFANSQPGQGSRAGPIARVPADPLIERDRLAAKANDLATVGHFSRAALSDVKQHPLVWFANVGIKSIMPSQTDGFEIELDWSRFAGDVNDLPPRLSVDRIIANVGYRPDRSIYEELHVHECYATQGPIKLAAKLLGETSADCLAQTNHGCDVLKNPEPNFFILGSKSYGRNSNFLLRVGHLQIQEVLNSIRSQS